MNQLKVTQAMIENAKDRKGIGLMKMDPYDFLKLTTDSSSVGQWIKEEHETTKPLDQYNEWATDGTIRVMPFLNINMQTGKVMGHEGRHRAAALMAVHGQEMWVCVFLKKDWYTVDKVDGKWLTEADIPNVLIGEFKISMVKTDTKGFKRFTRHGMAVASTEVLTPRSKHAMSVGALIYARDTGKFLLGKRSATIEDPNVWGTFGGGVDANESLECALRRELQEEAGYAGDIETQPLYVHHDQKTGFRYFNHLGVVPKQFEPKLNHETSEVEWFTWPEHPSPLHPGVHNLFEHPPSRIVIESVVNDFPLRGTT